MINKLSLILVGVLLSTSYVFAQATDDNEIIITQSGDTLELYIDQIGFGNKIGGSDFSSSSTAMTITGSGLSFNFDFIGNQNILFGPVVTDNSDYTLSFTGDSNEVDWNIGYIGSTDDSNLDINVTGDSNTFDFDQGYATSAERLDLDLTLIGGSNVFDIDVESDDVTWDFDITGTSNDINTLQNDGSQSIEFTLDGDNADINIDQLSGSCATGASAACSTPDASIVLDVTSDNAIITIVQKDSSGDS